MTKDKAMQQALEALEVAMTPLAKDRQEVLRAITALRTAMLQPPLPEQEPDRRALQAEGTHPAPCARHCEAKAFEIEIRGLKSALKQAQPVQEPVACRFCHSKKGSWTWQCYKCGEIDDVQKPAPPQQQAEPVSMRMPKVGDKVICIEDESLGEVVSLTAGGSPDITFDDGSRGTYLLREFFELFGYVNSHQQQAEPLAWLYPEGLEALQNGKCWTAYPTEHEDCKIPLYTTPQQQQAEPVAWDKPSASFNEWWDGDRRRDTANPFTTDSFSYWAWEGWQAALAQRPWQGLEAEDLAQIESDEFWQVGNHMAIAMAVEAKLKEKNHD